MSIKYWLTTLMVIVAIHFFTGLFDVNNNANLDPNSDQLTQDLNEIPAIGSLSSYKIPTTNIQIPLINPNSINRLAQIATFDYDILSKGDLYYLRWFILLPVQTIFTIAVLIQLGPVIIQAMQLLVSTIFGSIGRLTSIFRGAF